MRLFIIADMLVTVENSAEDVFGVIFAAQSSKCPWKALLVYSVTLRNCLFAELAACQEVLQCVFLPFLKDFVLLLYYCLSPYYSIIQIHILNHVLTCLARMFFK